MSLETRKQHQSKLKSDYSGASGANQRPELLLLLEPRVLRNQELTMHLMKQDGCHTEFGNHKP